MSLPQIHTQVNGSVNPLRPLAEPQEVRGQETAQWDVGGRLIQGAHNWRVTHLKRGRIEFSEGVNLSSSKGSSTPCPKQLPGIAAKALKLGVGIAIKTIPLLVALV